MKALTKLLPICALAVLALGCEERTDRTDSGGVLLDVAFTGTDIPGRVSVNGANNIVQVPTITITSRAAEPGGVISALMDVEIETLEVIYERADVGTRVPPPFIFQVLGTVPINGTLTLNDWPVMSIEQFQNPPISDLFIANGGFDKETGATVIRLNLNVRVFGRTRSGKEVASVMRRSQTIEFVQ